MVREKYAMDILERLPAITGNARELWERHTVPADLSYEAVLDQYEGIKQDAAAERGLIVTGDSLNATKTLLAAVTAGVQEAPELIYMDPPFFTNVKYVQTLKITGADDKEGSIPIHAFSDKWDETAPAEDPLINNADRSDTNGADHGDMDTVDSAAAPAGAVQGETSDFERYLMMLALRITAAYDLLSESGSLWIHLDHHAAHYVKVLTDQIFGGPEHLLNEVIWQYKSGGATKKHFSRKHDTLLFYAKDPAKHRFSPMLEKSYNRGRKPYRFKGVKEYRDEGGWYTLVNMRDVWQIDMVGRTSGERTGFATQKPEALLERIVSSSTAPGDLCIDLFGGSGTLAAVCEKSGRRWMSIDVSRLASLNAEKRMAGLGAAFEIMDGGYTVADNMPEEGASRWILTATYQPTADPSKSLVTITPLSYTVPNDVILYAPKQREMLQAAAEKYPAQFAAGIAADIKYDEALFRPQHARYGAGALEMLIENDLLSGRGGRHCVAYGVGYGKRPPEAYGGEQDGGASAGIMVRVIDIFGNAEIKSVQLVQAQLTQP